MRPDGSVTPLLQRRVYSVSTIRTINAYIQAGKRHVEAWHYRNSQPDPQTFPHRAWLKNNCKIKANKKEMHKACTTSCLFSTDWYIYFSFDTQWLSFELHTLQMAENSDCISDNQAFPSQTWLLYAGLIFWDHSEEQVERTFCAFSADNHGLIFWCKYKTMPLILNNQIYVKDMFHIFTIITFSFLSRDQ